MKYTKEDFDTDIAWLEGQGVDTAQIKPFIRNLLSSGFTMTRDEFVKFMKEVKG